MRQAAQVMCVVLGVLVVSQQARATERIAIAVGNNLGLVDDEPLRYAEQDAEQMRDLLVDLGGVDAERAYLLKGADSARLHAVLIEVSGRVAEIAREGKQSTVLFYFAGHGDAETLHMGRSSLARSQLLAWLAALSTNLRVVVLDTCSLPSSRSRGVRRADAFDVSVDETTAKGTVLLVSTRAGEPAQESDRLQGAVFTHYLLSGLRGAADHDGDGRVTLAEVYSYSYRRTVARSASGALALQHPTFDLQLQGAGDVILSEPRRSDAALLLPPRQDAMYLVYGLPSGTVLAEVSSHMDQALRLAVPPGRLLVQRRQGSAFAVVEVFAAQGKTQRVDDEAFQSVPYEEVALRGGNIDLHPTALGAGVNLASMLVAETPLMSYGPELLLSHRIGQAVAGARVAVEFTNFDSVQAHVNETAVRLDVLGGGWLQFGPTTLHLQAGPRLTVAHQAVERFDAKRLQSIGIDPNKTLWTTRAGGLAALTLSLPVSSGVSLWGGLQTSIQAAKIAQGASSSWQPVLGGGLSLAVLWSP